MSVPAYRPGDWTAVACPGFVALLDPSVPAETVRSVWERGADGVLGALAVLARQGFEGLPGFALVAVRGQRVHVVQRGDVEVVVSSAVGSRTLTADGVTTWTEQVLEPATAVELRVAGSSADESAWPLGDGAAAASAVQVSLVPAEAAEGTAAIPAVAAELVAEPVAEPVATEPVAAESVAAEPVAVAPVAAEQEPVAAEPEPEAPEPVAAVEPEPEPEPEPELEPEPDDAPALVPLESEPTPVVPAPAPVPTQQSAPAPEPTPAPVATPAFAATEPGTGPSTSPTALPALVSVGASSVDDHDGLTILSTDLAAIRERLPSWAADWTGGEAVPGPFEAPKQDGPVPQLVLSTGLVVPLDRSVLLGRAPQVARVTNSELPHLVTVPSPQQDISRTHAEVRVENGQVLVTDLASTNGVHVTKQGEGARRLHPGEATVVEAGHVVDLGDGVTFTVERGS
ncbi:FHA domain-containing protein [Cellulomonas sp. PhB150]|nr:FHA domain-containing protein [Cellulomonas sp. PhB150]ROS31034.1 FHA domain-containing protein [Cellulomonas sp. PhB150]